MHEEEEEGDEQGEGAEHIIKMIRDGTITEVRKSSMGKIIGVTEKDYVVTELVTGRELFKIVPLDETRAKNLWGDVVRLSLIHI